MGVLSRIIGPVCLVAALFAGPAFANTIYVSASNLTGIEDGTAAYPFRTIAKAMAVAVSGTSWETADTVLVRPGYYYGYFYLKSFVKLVGTSPKTVRVSGTISAAAGVPVPNQWIEGITVERGGIEAWNRVRLTDPSFWEVRNCYFYGAEFPIYARGAAFVNASRCLFYDSDSAIHLYYTSGVTTLTHCTIDRGSCENEGIALFSPSPSNRVELVNSIISNTRYIVGPWYGGTAAWQVTADHCDLWNGSVPAGVVRIASISADPKYRGYDRYGSNAPDDQRQLSSNSPCIDAGKDLGLPFLGAAPDMGAFEGAYTRGPTLPELLTKLEKSFSDLDQDSLKGPSEQRWDAFCNKMDALLKEFHLIQSGQLTVPDRLAAYREIRDKLTGDLQAKCDAAFGGNPANDWVDDAADAAFLYNLIGQILPLVDKEIAKLGG